MRKDKTVKKVVKGVNAAVRVYNVDTHETEEIMLFIPFTHPDEVYIKRYAMNHVGKQVLEILSLEEASESYQMDYQEFKARMGVDMDKYMELINTVKNMN